MSSLNFFYSYCRQDKEQRQSLEKHLSMLVRNKVINQWYDGKITAGSPWETKILENLESADIVVFLITTNWLNSGACIEEWEQAKLYAKSQPNKRLIPIIASECAWMDFDDMKSMQALPSDGKPVTQWKPMNSAWSNVYEGIKAAAMEVKKNFKLKPKFENELKGIEFCSTGSEDISLEDVFVFPNLTTYTDDANGVELVLDTIDDLMQTPLQFVIGENQSGKTKLCSWIYLQLNKKASPCIYIDLAQIGNSKDKNKILKDHFTNQQTGDFEAWLSLTDKTIVFDNLTKENSSIVFIEFVADHFTNILICTSTDIYRSYYIDDDRFVNYKEVNIRPFCHSKQEELIKNWLSVKGSGDDVDHNLIDSIETNINAIIIDNKVLPRFPFFILSILQTYESFMPENLKITAYGHCYHALILARLIKSGINQEDSALESAFTFCSNLAYKIFAAKNGLFLTENEFNEFKKEYSSEYIIKNAIFNRLFSEYGLLANNSGRIEFAISYSYYFFLGKYLTDNYADHKNDISEMVESSFARHNSLTLIFTIHHANDISIIDEILAHTMCAIDEKEPAKLTKEETSIFNELLHDVIPEKIESSCEVDVERTKERKLRTKQEENMDSSDETIERLASKSEMLNQVFQCNKNIEILSQILKNKTGSLKKAKIAEIVEIICDAGLRLASIMLGDDREIKACVKFVYGQYKKSDNYDDSKTDSFHLNEIHKMVTFRGMVWVLSSVEKSVKAINKPELRDIVSDLVNKKDSPAYHLIKYFYLLDTSSKFDENLKQELEFMIRTYSRDKSVFLNRIVSIRTQHYEKTHRIQEKYRQAIFSLLKLKLKKVDIKLNALTTNVKKVRI
jgi:hypothetical protein